MKYHDVVSKDKFDLGRASVIQHKIKMRDTQPLHARQFRIPFAHEETIFDYVSSKAVPFAIFRPTYYLPE